jgi:hypothetical protein
MLLKFIRFLTLYIIVLSNTLAISDPRISAVELLTPNVLIILLDLLLSHKHFVKDF